MKYFSITGNKTGRQNWLTIRLFILEISIAFLGIKKLSIRLTISYGW